ncbi:MAG TPA: MBL fold metallo-hydrolase [Gemmatimonadales bacterium]
MSGPHHAPAGGYRNPWPGGELPRLRGFLKWTLVERFTRPRAPDPARDAFPLSTPAFHAPRARADTVTVTWVGHASFLLQIGGLNVLTDPVWSDRASPVSWAGPRRFARPGIAFDALPPIDVVLQSHNHYDHLDDVTVRRLAVAHPRARWLVPLGLGAFISARGAADVAQWDWWDQRAWDGVTIACVPAQHFSARGFSDRNRTLWCGWAIAAGGRRVYFAGDSGYHPEFVEIGRRFGPFDVSLLPVGAYDPRWFMRPVHMDPEEAVRAYRDLHAAHGSERRGAFVPMHWGTFRLTDEPMTEPPERAARAWSAAGLPAAGFWRLAHGETRAR